MKIGTKIEYNIESMYASLLRLSHMQEDWQSYHFPDLKNVGCGATADQQKSIYNYYKSMYDEMITLVTATQSFMKKLDDNYVEVDQSVANELKQ